MKGRTIFKGSELLYVVVFLEIDFLLHGKHVNEKWKIKKINILFDLIRSINKLAFVRNLNLYIPTVYKHIKRIIKRWPIIYKNKIKSAPAWKLSSL